MDADDIDTLISSIKTILTTITASPQPNYSVDGESVSFDTYKNSLIKNIEDLLRLKSVIGGPFEVRTRAR
jgi:hypothetical protein